MDDHSKQRSPWKPLSLLHHSLWKPLSLLHHSLWKPLSLLHHSLWKPLSLLHHSLWKPLSLLHHSLWKPLSLLHHSMPNCVWNLQCITSTCPSIPVDLYIWFPYRDKSKGPVWVFVELKSASKPEPARNFTGLKADLCCWWNFTKPPENCECTHTHTQTHTMYTQTYIHTHIHTHNVNTLTHTTETLRNMTTFFSPWPIP